MGFYNVGLNKNQVNKKGWKIKERKLKEDIVNAFEKHSLDVLCLCELGELNDGLGDQLSEGLEGWIWSMIADSAVQPVQIYGDGHYCTIIKAGRVAVKGYKVVQGFHPQQPERSFQHFRVLVDDIASVVTIVNCHAPASKKTGLTMAGRKHYLQAFHDASGADPFIWGGDINTGVMNLSSLMKDLDMKFKLEPSSAAQPGAVEVVYSHPLRAKHGDLALVHGLCAIQVNSEVGNFQQGVSDAHDLVVAKVCVPRADTAAEPQPPEHASSSSNSAAQPVPVDRGPPPTAMPSSRDTPIPRVTQTHPLVQWQPKKDHPVQVESSSYSYSNRDSGDEASSSAAQPAVRRKLMLKAAKPVEQQPEPPKVVLKAAKPVEKQPDPPKVVLKAAAQLAASSAVPVVSTAAASSVTAQPAAPSVAAQPAASSAVPVVSTAAASSAVPVVSTAAASVDDSISSAAQPADSSAVPVVLTAAQPMVLRAATPRVDEIFGSDHLTELHNLLEKIGREFLFGRVPLIVATTTGCYERAAPLLPLEKLEHFLEVIQEQRKCHLFRHPELQEDAIFSSSDMQEIHQTWMHDYRGWMSRDKVQEYEWYIDSEEKGAHQWAHQLRRRAFSAYQFQIIGNKHVLMAAIQHPICSAAQPATSNAISRFMDKWEEEKQSADYKKRVEISEKLTEERRALKKAAHAARQELVRASRINGAILRGTKDWNDLTATEKRLLDDFNSGKLFRIRDQCDAAFGWNQSIRSAVSSAASRVGQ